MFKDPQEFYKSKEWERFRANLILQRTNPDGTVTCSKCGKPIVRKYDMIGHHKTELTEENVNDYNVSLNPENVELIHFRCHNLEHERFEGFRQRVFLVYGSPCSGKSSFVREQANGDDLILDVDRIWDAVCLDGWKSKPRRLNPIVFRIRDEIIDAVRTRTGKWRNCWIVGGFPLKTDRDRICQLLRAEPIYCEATLEECLARCKEERPPEWETYIRDWFEDFTPG